MKEVICRLKGAFQSCSGLSLQTSWDLALIQIDIAVNGTVDENSFEDVYATLVNGNCDFWEILLSAAIIYKTVCCSDELRNKLTEMYAKFLSCAFVDVEDQSEDFVRVHTFFVTQLLLCNQMTISDTDLIASSLTLGICNTEAIIRSSETQSIVTLSTRSLLELTSYLLQKAADEESIRSILLKDSFLFLQNVTGVVLSLSSSFKECRCAVAKLLLVPFSRLLTADTVPPRTVEDLLFLCWNDMCIPLLVDGDVDTCSIVGFSVINAALSRGLCSFLTTRLCRPSEEQQISFSLWDLTLQCLQHRSSLVVRKRGASILQDMISSGGVGDAAGWCRTYLAVYQQLEGCISMHLVSQVWGDLNGLIRESVSADETLAFQTSSGGSAPTLSFPWIVVLLRCVLSSQHLPIKKSFLYKILTGELDLPICHASIEWVCGELLMTLDSTVYFTTAFCEFPEEVLWKRKMRGEQVAAGDDMIVGDSDDNDAIISTASHPGILLSVFLGNWIVILVKQYRMNRSEVVVSQLEHLVCAVTRTVCGGSVSSYSAEGEQGRSGPNKASTFKSLSAVKWVLRVFSYEVIQDHLIFEDRPICSIGQQALISITNFIKEKFFSMSKIITAQVYSGLVPLLLCTRHNESEEDRCNRADMALVKSERIRVFMDLLAAVGLSNILNSQRGWRLLHRALMDTICIDDGDTIASSNVFDIVCARPKQAAYLAVWMGIVGTAPITDAALHYSQATLSDMQAVALLCEDIFASAGRIYTSTYIDVGKQWVVLWFLRGLTSLLCCIRNAAGDANMQSTGDHWVFEHDYCGRGDDALEKLEGCSYEILSYISFILLSTARAGVIAQGMQRLEVCAWDDLQSVLGVFCDTVSLMFAFSGHSIADFESSLGIVEALLHHLLEDMQRVNMISSQDLTVQDSFTKLMCAHICSKCLHTLRAISHQSTLSSCKIEQQKGALIHIKVQIVSKSFAAMCSTHAIPSTVASVHTISILHDLQQHYQSFGKYYGELNASRWLGVSSALHLMRVHDRCRRGQLLVSCVTAEVSSNLLQESIEQIGLCAKTPISHILNSLRLLVDHLYDLHCTHATVDSTIPCQLEELVFAAWTSCTDGDGLCYQNIKLFIQLCFDKHALMLLSPSSQQKLFEAIITLGQKTKPYIIQFLMYRLCRSCEESYVLSFPFFKYFKQLLLYREPILDDHNLTDSYMESDGIDGAYIRSVYSVMEYSRVTGIDRYTSTQSVRILVLQFLESMCSTSTSDNVLRGYVQVLVKDLVSINREKVFVRQSMVGSEKFGEKLRCWQALCVLANYVDEELAHEILEPCLATLGDPCAHAIRVHMELFLGALAHSYLDIILPKVLSSLRVFNHSQQVLSSYFVIVGYLVKRNNTDESALDKWKHQLVCDIMPWLTCAAGLSRAVAQYVAYILIPQVLPPQYVTPVGSNRSVEEVGVIDRESVHFMRLEIWRFLDENKDAMKLRSKQDSFFDAFSVPNKCSVAGLLCIQYDQFGEHVPEHILTILLNAVRNNLLDDDGGDGYSDSLNALPAVSSEPSVKSTAECDYQLQTKINPFDELQLAIESSLLSRQRNGADRTRQDLVVCASLIDKVTNLAGIVRTCEIFAVKEVTIPDISILQNFEFQSISVASAGWMPIREVAYDDVLSSKTAFTSRSGELVRYLREMRAGGYQIVGIEQTGASLSLNDTTAINPKCVLVLGKEKEGIPLDILQEVDICIEIPQFGVTRSLNVHVSAALVIWEVTKTSLALKNISVS